LSEIFWTDQAFVDKMATEYGIVGVGISNDEGIVKCELEVLPNKSLILDLSKFDHVVEASVKIESGILLVQGCPIPHVELELKMIAGDYRIRVYSSNLRTAFDARPKDFYQIEIWEEAYSERIVLKRYLE
jgi:hypothetical protein